MFQKDLDKFSALKISQKVLYWVDGIRTLDSILELLNARTSKAIKMKHLIAYLKIMQDLGHIEMKENETIQTKADLIKDLKRIGIKKGMNLLVHSAFSKIGQVEGGPETVIDALLNCVGKNGNLMMPSFNHGYAGIYNPLSTPCISGLLPDTFWRRKEAIRSDHPSHSVAVIGPKADIYCREHTINGIWSNASPIARLMNDDGFILSLGVTHHASTVYHLAEIACEAGCLDQFGVDFKVAEARGNIKSVKGLAWRKTPCPVKINTLNKTMEKARLQEHGKIGSAASLLCRASDIFEMRKKNLNNLCRKCLIKPNYRTRKS
jgi:aminoglycoside 3-N-acetyltransferase